MSRKMYVVVFLNLIYTIINHIALFKSLREPTYYISFDFVSYMAGIGIMKRLRRRRHFR